MYTKPVYNTGVHKTSLQYRHAQNQFTVKVYTKPVLYCLSPVHSFEHLHSKLVLCIMIVPCTFLWTSYRFGVTVPVTVHVLVTCVMSVPCTFNLLVMSVPCTFLYMCNVCPLYILFTCNVCPLYIPLTCNVCLSVWSPLCTFPVNTCTVNWFCVHVYWKLVWCTPVLWAVL